MRFPDSDVRASWARNGQAGAAVGRIELRLQDRGRNLHGAGLCHYGRHGGSWNPIVVDPQGRADVTTSLSRRPSKSSNEVARRRNLMPFKSQAQRRKSAQLLVEGKAE